MTDKKSDETPATGVEDVTLLATAVAAVEIAAHNGGVVPAAVAVGLAVAPSIGRRLVNTAGEAWLRRQHRRFDQWVADVAATMGFGKPEDVEKLVDENVDEPWAHTAVTDAARAIAQEIDEAAMPALVRLTAHRLEDHRGPDEEVKRAVALLMAMNTDDVASMRSLLERTREAWRTRHGALVVLLGNFGSPHTFENSMGVSLRTPMMGQVGSNEEVTAWTRAENENFVRLLRLLKHHGFAAENPPTNQYGVDSGPHAAAVQPKPLAFLAQLFL